MSFRKLVSLSECEKQNGRENVTTVAVTVSPTTRYDTSRLYMTYTEQYWPNICTDTTLTAQHRIRSGYKSSFTYKVPVNYMQAFDTIPTVTTETRTRVLQILIIALRRPILISTHSLIRKHKHFTEGSQSWNKK